ncbi:MAG: hypothetical protein Q8N60_04300 [Candidatus Diapherotrites archaeon]|nr:hypothetical protein [Candidatus Diapherotrites archaeon]
MPAAKSASSIIAIIQDMVKAGEPEEKIIKSLAELGVKPDQARRLLLLGEANTFALLQNEINKIVGNYFEQEKPKLAEFIREEVGRISDEMLDKIERRALNAFKEDQRFIENQATMFQARVNQSVKNVVELHEETKAKINELNGRFAGIERDSWALKQRVFGSKLIKAASTALIAMQVVLIAASFYLLFTTPLALSPQTLILIATIGVVLVTMIYLAVIKP